MKVKIEGTYVNSVSAMRTFVDEVESIYNLLKSYNNLELIASMELRLSKKTKA